MTPPRPTPSASPRGSVLAALVALVLGLHLVLIAGDITLRLPGITRSLDASPPDASASAPHAEPARTAAAAAPRAPVVRVSTVRWIVPAPQVVAPPPKPERKAAPAPRPAPAPQPVAVLEPPAQPAETLVVAASEAPAPSQDVAVIEPAPPPPTPVEPMAAPPAEPETPLASEPTDTDDAQLAAAGTQHPARAGAALPPATPPPATRLLYDVTGNVKGIGYKAQGALDWAVADGRYEARMEMRVLLLGSRSQTSTGRIGPNGLMPERFADKSRSEKATHFDNAQQRIRFSSNAPEVPLQPGAQDRLSLFLQLASLLQARPQAYTTGQTVDMQVAGTGDAPIWRFEVGEESTMSLPAGEFKVRHLVRQPRKEFDSTVEMWLAPSLHHLPVRLRVKQANGDVADQQLSQMP